jgi:formiminotetrahydrofolate cyclodeaminase
VPDQNLAEFLESLSARTPVPGGGAAAALHLGQAAALLGMVARYSTGPKYQEHAELIADVIAQADELRGNALWFAEQDAAAFQLVADAYALPKGTEEERLSRSRSIAEAALAAAQPPAEVVAAAWQALELTEKLAPVGNRNVITDVAAAAEALRAAAVTAQVNIEINLAGAAEEQSARLRETAAGVDALAARAEAITAAVRKEIAR